MSAPGDFHVTIPFHMPKQPHRNNNRFLSSLNQFSPSDSDALPHATKMCMYLRTVRVSAGENVMSKMAYCSIFLSTAHLTASALARISRYVSKPTKRFTLRRLSLTAMCCFYREKYPGFFRLKVQCITFVCLGHIIYVNRRHSILVRWNR